MNPVDNSPGVFVANAAQVTQMENLANQELQDMENALDERAQSSLASHIEQAFQDNVDNRQTSGIEEKMLQSLRAYNGKYDPEDLAQIKRTGGSEIYMNLTPTKCRAAMSWIRDIMLPAKENAWSLEPTPVPDVPMEVKEILKKQVEQFLQNPQEPKPGEPPQQGGPGEAATKIKDANRLAQDLEDAYLDEVYRLAKKEVKKFESVIADQLAEGDWDIALSEFVEDFCVFPIAIMKGPIITKKKVLAWQNGQPVIDYKYKYKNKRVSPLDIYPSASATHVNDGNLCELLRLSSSELYNLIGTKGYNEDNIRDLLERYPDGMSFNFLNTHIEEEKSEEEDRGDSFSANSGVFHGVHYWGPASYEMLDEWGISKKIIGTDRQAQFEIEAILIGDQVIKCRINSDPLLRRPYFKASFQSTPGSWWGRSLPDLMRDIQRLCNATARSLANNMGVAAGPQVEVYLDRLAADEEIEDIYPFKIWQVTSDPTGGSGRAVQFWQPSSNAGELLTVYKEFEIRADDATGIPRYAYGNERVGGAAQTASGLSMLLESASKGIKDAIRHIDDGLIKPRVEYQFYMNMVTSESDVDFTGDIVVVARGSQALTMRGAQEMRRNEFLQILSNERYLQIVGVEGVAEILREMAKALGLGENIVPSRIELQQRQQKMEQQQAAMQQQEQEIEAAKVQRGLQQVQMQTQQADAASQRGNQIKVMELQDKRALEEQKLILKAHELAQQRETSIDKQRTELTKQQMADAQRDRDTNKNIALSIQSGYKDKSNVQ